MTYLNYLNDNATRNKALDPRLVEALGFLPQMGLTADVISGGQDAKGEGSRRTGSTRHDHGGAADLDFRKADGTKLSWHNPDHLPLLQEIVSRSRQGGATGIGAGDDYMGDGRMHIGFGAEGVWGADGKAANAPDWLRSAYYGGEAPDHDHDHGEEAEQQGIDPNSFGGRMRTKIGLGEGGARDKLRAHMGLGDKQSDRMGRALAQIGLQMAGRV